MAPAWAKLIRRPPADLASAAVNRAIESRLGVRTGGSLALEEAGAAAPNRVWHTPSDWIPIWRSLRELGVGPSDVLLDYGSGRGRALVAARRLPFRRVVGVEVSPMLADAGRLNLSRQAGRVLCRDAEVVVADAALWVVPDDITVVYMYCPFTGPVFSAAIARLLDSIDRRARRVRLVYNNPYEHNFLLQTGRFRPIVVRPAAWPAWGERARMVIVSYELLPARVDDPRGDPGRLGPWAGYCDLAPTLSGDFESAFDPALAD
jgi:hypothetical protein